MQPICQLYAPSRALARSFERKPSSILPTQIRTMRGLSAASRWVRERAFRAKRPRDAFFCVGRRGPNPGSVNLIRFVEDFHAARAQDD